MDKIIKTVSMAMLVALLVTCPAFLNAQQKFTVSGYVKNSATGEALIGANVFVKELLKGSPTNTYGFYSITLPNGTYTLTVTFMGYNEYFKKIDLNKDIKMNISLEEKVFQANEVVISAVKEDQNIQSTDMGRVEIPIEKIKSLPVLFGEVDILKTIQLTPGVKSAGEGSTGYYVRGGGPDQNLILLDEAVVYNAAHLMGFFSVFNADALNNIDLIKAGMPANYGGRLASVLDITMKEGNDKKYHIEGGLGLISSRLTAQGPIVKEKSSFIVSGRRTYADLLMKPFVNDDSQFKGFEYYFYDLNAKLNYRFSDKDRLFLSGYYGRDDFSLKSPDGKFDNTIKWGNATASLRWNHLFSNKVFMNSSVVFTDYRFELGARQDIYLFKLYSGIQDWNMKMDVTYLPSMKHNIKFGIDYTYHIFTPNNATASSEGVPVDLGKEVKLYSHDGAIYISDDFDLNDRIKINGGLRYTHFQQVGPFDRYIRNNLNQTIDTIHYDRNKSVAAYNHVEPRIAIRVIADKHSSVKASYTLNYQYIHLVSTTGVSLPTDVWVPCSDLVKPQVGMQYSLGYYRNFFSNLIEASIEGYYKSMQNQIEYKEGALVEDNVRNNTDNNFVFGKGQSYGAELFIKKPTGNLTGWIGYTLSWTNRTFPDINGGRAFPAKYDRRHDVSIVVTYLLKKKWTLSAVWVYNTGDAMTLPVARYFIDGNIINQYSDRNAFRMPSYHRLDLSVTYLLTKGKRFESNLNLSVYNVYNRKNPYYIYYDITGSVEEMQLDIKAKQVSLFPILPSISWNFKF